ncbi:prohead protease/major capsid protein fusion protein [Pseudoalteromonas sp. Of7M-16]|uniref:prohead protease/major capsid protein fusion protein n=1 Tax=Pseudoalteromonas sp. Of7M-16 TaxID=2917756 RepID=UPI001EF6D0EE|nr:prohead protease/major capsid protein fusion protein [Pseudoalteromonas sp. Of7M-16]MCG7548577.1 hypothetical protein [Pseudoalteromonas sp. Of7M-16]
MPTNKQVRQGTFSVRAEIQQDTIDVENRTAWVCFSTGEAGRRYDWWNDTEYMEELDITPESIRTARLDKGLSVCDNHNTWSCRDVFGITEQYKIENGEILGLARFATDPASEEMWIKVKDRILRHVSLGYKVHKFQKSQADDDKIPTYRAIDWEPTELSFTPVSFETTNGVRSEQERTKENLHTVIIEDVTMPSEDVNSNETTDKTRSEGNNNLPPVEQPAQAGATEPVARSEGNNNVPPVEQPAPQAATASRADLTEMLAVTRKIGLDDQVAIDAYTRGDSVDSIYKTAVNAQSDNSQKNSIRNYATFVSDGRSDQRENIRKAGESFLLQRSGRPMHENVSQTLVRDFTGMTLFDMARFYVDASGGTTLGLSRQALAARAFHSTSDFPLLLENVMNKNLQEAYQETPQTFRDLGRRTTVNDFREKKTYSLSDAPNLLPLGEDGEYKAGTFTESGEAYSIATFARKIGFTRQMLINDDMGAFDRVAPSFGRAGRNLESNIVWGLILGFNFFTNKPEQVLMRDKKPVYHAQHNNLLEAGSKLSKDNLKKIRKLGRQQKTLSKDYMNVTWDHLAVSDENEALAEELLYPSHIANTMAEQHLRHKMQLLVEPRISAVNEQQYHVFSNMLDTFEYAYLAGEEEMYTETYTSHDIDGMKILVRKDFGAGWIDHRGTAMATGAQ